jgi:tRNA threonylcarbamoyladenosine biosynthesis protein TsaE
VVAKEYYQGRLELYHIDLYRIDNINEVLELGLEEYFYRGGVSVVEWADRGLGTLPEEHLLIKLDYLDENERLLSFEPSGKRYLVLVQKLWGRR